MIAGRYFFGLYREERMNFWGEVSAIVPPAGAAGTNAHSHSQRQSRCIDMISRRTRHWAL